MHYGETGWWPAETPDEVIIGAVLTQNTAWRNVELSLQKMKERGITTLADLAESEAAELGETIRSSGFYRQKSGRLIAIASAILETYGSIGNMKEMKTVELQNFLLSLKGIGQETMDCILLYVLEKPEFVVDKYTIRILERIGVQGCSTINGVKKFVNDGLYGEVEKMKNLHGMLVELAKDFCRITPACTDCPVRKICDYGSTKIR